MNALSSGKKTTVIPGGFDPLHPRHITMIEVAVEHGELHRGVGHGDGLIVTSGL